MTAFVTQTAPLPAPDWEPAGDVNRRNTALQRAVQVLANRHGRALEVGAGTARFLRAICREAPGLHAHASDRDAPSLVRAVRADTALAVTQSDLTALPYLGAAFDVVLVFDVLEHLHRPELGVQELARVTAPGGVLHALIPCEGQPLTLHWLMWRLGVKAQLKEQRVGHVQRFTHGSAVRLLESCGFQVTEASWSMHPIGQVRDILSHLSDEPSFPSAVRANPLFKAVLGGLWLAAYVESMVLRRVPFSAVALHVTAVRR